MPTPSSFLLHIPELEWCAAGRIARTAHGEKLEVRQVAFPPPALASSISERFAVLSAWSGQAGDLMGIKAFFRHAAFVCRCAMRDTWVFHRRAQALCGVGFR